MDDQPQAFGHQPNQDARGGRRYRRLADYQQKAVKNADPLVATLAVINSDLMGFAFRLSQAIEGAVGADAVSLQEVHQIDPALNSYLRVAKQIDRFTQLAIHLGKSEKPAIPTVVKAKKRTSPQAKKPRLDTHSRSPATSAGRRK